jgi:hypothetical protein
VGLIIGESLIDLGGLKEACLLEPLGMIDDLDKICL